MSTCARSTTARSTTSPPFRLSQNTGCREPGHLELLADQLHRSDRYGNQQGSGHVLASVLHVAEHALIHANRLSENFFAAQEHVNVQKLVAPPGNRDQP